MPRFAVVVVVLLAAGLAAGAVAAWQGGWLQASGILKAMGVAPPASPAGDADLVQGAADGIRNQDVAAVRQYLAAGGDPNAADAEGEILLNIAVLHGSPEILEALLSAGADPDEPGKNGLGPLTIAALAGRQAMLDRLMRANAARPAAAAPGGKAPVAERIGSPSAGGGDAVTASQETPVRGADTAAAPDGSAAVLASLTGDGELQPGLPAEPYASMAGLVINPIARPTSASGPAAVSAGSAAPVPAPAGDAAAAATTSPGGGAPTAWVSAAQRRLGQLGYYKGPVTGFAGPLTAEAVKRYQAVAGIPQDGIVSADLLRRIGATVGAPAAPAPPAPPAASAPPPAADGVPAGAVQATGAQAAGPGLQQVRNALGQEFNSATRPDALRQHCQANANAWVYDEAMGRSMFCRDVLGSPPR